MKENIIVKKNNLFYLNQYQWFALDDKRLKQNLNKLKFPIMILDLEFFNQSHDLNKIEPKLYGDDPNNKSVVYILSYAIITSLKELTVVSYEKEIKELRIRRRLNDDQYNFKIQYDRMIKSFFNIILKNDVETILVAGKSNDKAILEQWVNEYRFLFKNKKVKVLETDKKQQCKLKIQDVYDTLSSCMAFSNYKSDGSAFYNSNYLKKGFIKNDTIQIPSLKKFFKYMNGLYDDISFEDNDNICLLCASALEFFSSKQIEVARYHKLNQDVLKSLKHCQNDVYKILEILNFWYYFSLINQQKNKYLKQESIICDN